MDQREAEAAALFDPFGQDQVRLISDRRVDINVRAVWARVLTTAFCDRCREEFYGAKGLEWIEGWVNGALDALLRGGEPLIRQAIVLGLAASEGSSRPYLASLLEAETDDLVLREIWGALGMEED